MSISLSQPSIGSTDWGGAANSNWATVEDAINNKMIAAGTLATRPAAASGNAGTLYFASDVNGGTLFRSDGSSWTQVAPGTSESDVNAFAMSWLG